MTTVTSPAKRPASKALLDLRFLELDVLARDRVVLLEDHLLGLVARIFLGHVEKAGVSRADELDLDSCRLGHREFPLGLNNKSGPRAAPLDRRAHWPQHAFLSTVTPV